MIADVHLRLGLKTSALATSNPSAGRSRRSRDRTRRRLFMGGIVPRRERVGAPACSLSDSRRIRPAAVIGHGMSVKWLWYAGALAAAGCGTSVVSSDGGADGGGDASSTDASAFADVAAEADAAFPMIPNDLDAEIDGGGLFWCAGCVCDGTGHYCQQFETGEVSADAGTVCNTLMCPAYADACADDHSCECLHMQQPDCLCGPDPTGDGLVVTCVQP